MNKLRHVRPLALASLSLFPFLAMGQPADTLQIDQKLQALKSCVETAAAQQENQGKTMEQIRTQNCEAEQTSLDAVMPPAMKQMFQQRVDDNG